MLQEFGLSMQWNTVFFLSFFSIRCGDEYKLLVFWLDTASYAKTRQSMSSQNLDRTIDKCRKIISVMWVPHTNAECWVFNRFGCEQHNVRTSNWHKLEMQVQNCTQWMWTLYNRSVFSWTLPWVPPLLHCLANGWPSEKLENDSLILWFTSMPEIKKLHYLIFLPKKKLLDLEWT